MPDTWRRCAYLSSFERTPKNEVTRHVSHTAMCARFYDLLTEMRMIFSPSFYRQALTHPFCWIEGNREHGLHSAGIRVNLAHGTMCSAVRRPMEPVTAQGDKVVASGRYQGRVKRPRSAADACDPAPGRLGRASRAFHCDRRPDPESPPPPRSHRRSGRVRRRSC